MATRGEDVSSYFTNNFTVVRPVKRVEQGLNEERSTGPRSKRSASVRQRAQTK